MAFSIAQVTPWPWEQHHEVNRFVEGLSDALCARGHRVAVVAPSGSRELVHEGREKVRALRSDPDAIFSDPGCASLLAVGQSLPFRRGGSVSLPLDVSRTLEDLLDRAELDFVHVHEPFAPSAASAALRHSRALNVGSFHSTTERFVSTQVARKVVELLFGRLDGRTASYAATRDLVERYFPGHYEVIRPGADLLHRPDADGGPPEIVLSAEEDRAALRLFLRALRKLPGSSTGAPRSGCAIPPPRPPSTSPGRSGSACGSPARPTAPRPSISRAPRSPWPPRPAPRPPRSSWCARSPGAPCPWCRACPSTRSSCSTASSACCSSRATR